MNRLLDGYVKGWWLVALRGLAAVAFGLICLIWPDAVLGALVLVFGAYALADGAVALGTGVVAASDGRRWWPMLLVGALGIGAGIVAIVFPGLTALALVGLIAGWAILAGIGQIMAAVQLRQEITDEWLLGLGGAASIVAGILLILFPNSGLQAIVSLIGAYAVLAGGLLIGHAFLVRQIGRGSLAAGKTEDQQLPAGA